MGLRRSREKTENAAGARGSGRDADYWRDKCHTRKLVAHLNDRRPSPNLDNPGTSSLWMDNLPCWLPRVFNKAL
jgi:hypothetical protein